MEELALLGIPIKKTYFAPVVRPTNLLSYLGLDFPLSRVEDLANEFDWELAVKY